MTEDRLKLRVAQWLADRESALEPAVWGEADVSSHTGPSKGGAAPSALMAAWLRFGENRSVLAESLVSQLGLDRAAVDQMLEVRTNQGEVLLTGAEAVALTLQAQGVETAYAYPGTSELALCDAIARLPPMRVRNAFGDKEAVFFAGGENMVHRRCAAVAVLHAARGALNAVGALSSLQRCERPLFAVVGLPSSRSARFLPPHEEPELLGALTPIVKHGRFLRLTGYDGAAAGVLVDHLVTGVLEANRPPAGPTVLGVPQDVLETPWVPSAVLLDRAERTAASSADAGEGVRKAEVVAAASQFLRGKRCAILVDDYALVNERVPALLGQVAEVLDAGIWQVRYRRGPMLFQRLTAGTTPRFRGWLDLEDVNQRRDLQGVDVILTVEDRNMYRRVVGILPSVDYVVVSSAPEKARKNEYPGQVRQVLPGEIETTLNALLQALLPRLGTGPADSIARTDCGSSRSASPDRGRISPMALAVARTIFRQLERAPTLLVDDSQMLGGMLSAAQEEAPAGLRVYGDHSGFVGSGLGYATGAAAMASDYEVLCLVGDHGFINGSQALFYIALHRLPVTVLVCSNGGSVSLRGQAASLGLEALVGPDIAFLDGLPPGEYANLAGSLGIKHQVVTLMLDREGEDRAVNGLADLQRALVIAAEERGPSLVELQLPAEVDFWRGIWQTRGLDEVTDGQ